MSGQLKILEEGKSVTTKTTDNGTQFYQSLPCNSGAGGDQKCIQAFSDQGACCMSMTLKNIPFEPETNEKKVLFLLTLGAFPIYENTEGHVCFTEKSRNALKGQVTTSKYG